MTNNAVPKSRLIEFAQPVRREVAIDPTGVYCTIGCHLYGEGVYERETKTGAEIKASRMFLIEKDDLVINRIWAQKGSAGIVPESLAGAVVTPDFPVWTLNPAKAFPPYIGWYLKTSDFWEECRRHSHGTSGRERLSPKELPNVMFPLPPLNEQRRIVARIEELTALIEEAQGLRVKAREETATLAAAAVVELFTAHQDDDWADYCLGDLVIEFRYGTSEKAHNEPSGTPILRMGNIQNGRLDLADLKYLYLTDRDREKLLLQPGDVLVNRTNSPELVGKCAVFEEEGEYAFASYLIRLRLDLTEAVPQLVAAYINSPVGRAYMFSHRKQMTGQANVNTKTLKAMPISLPPVEEQRRIVAYLDGLQAQVDELTALQDATQAELDVLLPSVLDRAFRGEL